MPRARVGKGPHMSWTLVVLLPTDKRKCFSHLQLPAKSQASSSPISPGSSGQCVTVIVCFAVPVQCPGLAAGLELHRLYHPGLQVSVGSSCSGNPRELHQEGELTPALLFKPVQTAFWSRLEFLLGSHQCSGFPHLEI